MPGQRVAQVQLLSDQAVARQRQETGVPKLVVEALVIQHETEQPLAGRLPRRTPDAPMAPVVPPAAASGPAPGRVRAAATRRHLYLEIADHPGLEAQVAHALWGSPSRKA